MDFEKIKEEIKKTGFVLENKVAKILEEHNWSVITNRYYLDDIKDIDREIDILAYKVREINNTLFYTTLIISCKKSSDEIWTFLTKELKEQNPNVKSLPIHNWTNQKDIQYMLTHQNIEDRIRNSKKEFLDLVYTIPRQVFAFQQLKVGTYKPQNDKDIYNSIITSIKALEFERSSLRSRKKESAFYNFNLLSIFDGKMVELFFSDPDAPDSEEINNIKYLNRHIVNKQDDFYRVHFVNFTSFKDVIHKYEELHEFNVEFYAALSTEFFKNIFEYKGAAKALLKDFETEVLWYIKYGIKSVSNAESLDIEALRIEDMKLGKDILYISLIGLKIPTEEEKLAYEFINSDSTIKQYIKEKLKAIYHYEGDYEIIDGFVFDFM